MFFEGGKFKKPDIWGFDKGLISPGWDWFWRNALFVYVWWERGGPPFDLTRLTKASTGLVESLWSVGEFGLCLQSTLTIDKFNLGDSSLILPTDQLTAILISEKTDATDRNSSAFGPGVGVLGERCHVHLPDQNGDYLFDFGGATEGTSRLKIATPVRTGTRRVVMRAGSRGMALWQNGIELGSHTTATPARSSTTDVLEINAGQSDADLVKLTMIGLFDDQWNDGQIIQWSNDPFGPIRMVDDLPLFVPAAAGAISDYRYRQRYFG